MSTIPKRIGPYKLFEEIGKGSAAVVYRAQDTRNHQVVALKVLLPELLRNPTYADHFMQVGKLGRNLHHEKIVEIYHIGYADGMLFRAMRYTDNGTLQDRLQQQKGPFPVVETVPILLEVAAALDSAGQSGYTHGNLKPSNILFTADSQILLTDFGVPSTVEFSLTPGMAAPADATLQVYRAPEQEQGNQSIDARTDVYSLAVLTYCMLTGERPSPAAGRSSFRRKIEDGLALQATLNPPQLSPALVTILRRALSVDPTQRHASVREFVDELAQVKSDNVTTLFPLAVINREAASGKSQRSVSGPTALTKAASSALLKPSTARPAAKMRNRRLLELLAALILLVGAGTIYLTVGASLRERLGLQSNVAQPPLTPTRATLPISAPAVGLMISATETLSPTSVVMELPQATAIVTPTSASTQTPLPTWTWTVTASPSATNTATPTAQPTATIPPTPTSTWTSAPTLVLNAVVTSSISETTTIDLSSLATATPGAINTVTATATVTSSDTSTSTPTQSSTATPTSSATNTATATPQPTATATPSFTPTWTLTPTLAATATSTPSATNTASATPQPMATATPSFTPTWTLTPTLAATATPTPSATNTASATPQPTATATPSFTPTWTLTPTLAATATPTPSATNTASATPQPTATATPSFTPTWTLTPTLAATATSTPSATNTASATPQPTATSTPSSTLTWTPSATAMPTVTMTATPNSIATTLARIRLTMTAQPTKTAALALLPSSTPTVAPTTIPTLRPPTPTRTPTPSPAATVASDPLARIVVTLLGPPNGAAIKEKTEFSWQSNLPLPEGYSFEPAFWQKEGGDALTLGRGWGGSTRESRMTLSPKQFQPGSGRYFWAIRILDANAKPLRLVSEISTINVEVPNSPPPSSGGGSNPVPPAPQPTNTPSRPD